MCVGWSCPSVTCSVVLERTRLSTGRDGYFASGCSWLLPASSPSSRRSPASPGNGSRPRLGKSRAFFYFLNSLHTMLATSKSSFYQISSCSLQSRDV